MQTEPILTITNLLHHETHSMLSPCASAFATFHLSAMTSLTSTVTFLMFSIRATSIHPSSFPMPWPQASQPAPRRRKQPPWKPPRAFAPPSSPSSLRKPNAITAPPLHHARWGSHHPRNHLCRHQKRCPKSSSTFNTAPFNHHECSSFLPLVALAAAPPPCQGRNLCHLPLSSHAYTSCLVPATVSSTRPPPRPNLQSTSMKPAPPWKRRYSAFRAILVSPTTPPPPLVAPTVAAVPMAAVAYTSRARGLEGSDCRCLHSIPCLHLP